MSKSMQFLTEEDVYKISYLVHRGWKLTWEGWTKEGFKRQITDYYNTYQQIEVDYFDYEEAYDVQYSKDEP